MNQRDRGNLEFIMNLSKSEIVQWWDTVDEDDRGYALELVTTRSKEILAKTTNCIIDKDIVNLDAARAVLSKWCKTFE